MPGLSQDKARLAALDPEAVCEQRGIISARVRRIRIDLGVKGLQLVRARGGLRPVKQLERDVEPGHNHLPYSGVRNVSTLTLPRQSIITAPDAARVPSTRTPLSRARRAGQIRQQRGDPWSRFQTKATGRVGAGDLLPFARTRGIMNPMPPAARPVTLRVSPAGHEVEDRRLILD
jgi:hypothetical protein